MRKELIVKSRSLVGTSDLTLLAPIIPGLVENSLEALTYKTRVKRLLEALNLGRASSHEYALLRPFSDAVERVGKIHSVRVTVFEPEDEVLLAVSFDGTWEAYIRVLWQKVGALLDAIFCNTLGYVTASEHSFEEWAGWVRKVQRETFFYYGMPGLTVDDVHYLRREEALHRHSPGHGATDVAATRQTVRSAEDQAWDVARHLSPSAVVETSRQALQSLSFIYRLTNLYPPDSPEGPLLKRAARELLREFVGLAETTRLVDDILKAADARFQEQLNWLLERQPPVKLPVRKLPALPAAVPAYNKEDVQAGIVGEYGDKITHGCMVLVHFEHPAAAAALLQVMQALVTPEALQFDPGQRPYVNLALTCEGLRALGLSEKALEEFPLEFRQGMEARASMLGDLRHNHPRRWARPRRWRGPQAAVLGGDQDERERVEMAEVHAIVQLRAAQEAAPTDDLDDAWLDDRSLPIVKALIDLHELTGRGVRLLAVEPLRRHRNADGNPREHFGFADGQSQPSIAPTGPGRVYDNQVHLGEVLLGYDNQADFAPHEGPAAPGGLLHNGSFLVVRKLRQDVGALEACLSEAVERTGIPRTDLLARMMGRTLEGDSLVMPGRGNDFDFSDDALGRVCPFHAHVRRANPRQAESSALPQPPGQRRPRLARRGMSYGPLYDLDGVQAARNEKERGLMFMAYNASIGEQFEAVQRWLVGGNSSGGYSDQSDPFLGVAGNGQRRHFRFEVDGQALSIPLDGADRPLEDPQPFVRVDWGAYLFAPSIQALGMLRAVAEAPAAAPVWLDVEPRPDADLRFNTGTIDEGRALLQQLPQGKGTGPEDARIEPWKIALEDPERIEKFQAAGLWAAVREKGGVLRTPYGVLVARRDLALRVLCHPEDFSVKGYTQRMKDSIGEIFLGQDPDSGSQNPKAVATNKAIYDIKREEAYDLAFKATQATLRVMIGTEKEIARQTQRPRWELNLSLRELFDPVLQSLCRAWFGLELAPIAKAPNQEFHPGSQRWDWKPGDTPYCPGHFTPPSRFIFQPWPQPFAEKLGCEAGQALKTAMLKLVRRRQQKATFLMPDGQPAPITAQILAAFEHEAAEQKKTSIDEEEAAHYLVGAMMGMLPTLDGNLSRVFDEWLRDGSFWSLRQAIRAKVVAAPPAEGALVTISLADAARVLLPPLTRTMQLRPAPELIWRTAKQPVKLGDVTIDQDEVVVVSLVSVTHEHLERHESDEGGGDLAMVFGGRRSDADHPTHACPGYEAALGVLQGTLAGLMSLDAPIRPSPARLSLNFEGPREGPGPTAQTTSSMARRVARMQTAQLSVEARGDGHGWILAEGDSWFDDLNHFGVSRKQNLLRMLEEEHDYRVNHVARSGDGLADMVKGDQLQAFDARLHRMKALGRRPKAIMLSAGGNDVIRESLAALLRPGGTTLKLALNEPAAEAKLKGMAGTLAKILEHYTASSSKLFGAPLPILLHGYDFPVPDGRNLFQQSQSGSSWLYPAFEELKITADLAVRAAIMKALIEGLNQMQKEVAKAAVEAGAPVTHVDLCNTLSCSIDDGGYLLDWDNELHPTERGFGKLAVKLAAALRRL